MIRCIGYVDEGSGNSQLSVPIFEIVQWVPRPDCLKDDAPQISAAPPVQPTAAPAPVVTPAAQASIPQGAAF